MFSNAEKLLLTKKVNKDNKTPAKSWAIIICFILHAQGRSPYNFCWIVLHLFAVLSLLYNFMHSSFITQLLYNFTRTGPPLLVFCFCFAFVDTILKISVLQMNQYSINTYWKKAEIIICVWREELTPLTKK